MTALALSKPEQLCDVVRQSGRVRMPSAFGRAEDRADGHPREGVAVNSTAAPSIEDADAGPRQHSVTVALATL